MQASLPPAADDAIILRELSAMQAANWIGRDTHAALGGVAAHLYAEFDGAGLDVERLRLAIGRLCAHHPMLRLHIHSDGRQSIGPEGPLELKVDDLRNLTTQEAEARLLARRQAWAHQRLDLSAGQAARFALSLRPHDQCRLHVDTDMIAIDPPSFRILMEDLAAFYEAPDREAAGAPSFFDWHDRAQDDATLAQAHNAARDWWRGRIADIPPSPSLPLLPNAAASAPRSHRLAARLGPAERQALDTLSRTRRITMATLMMGLFAAALARATGDRRYRLNIPMFWREPLVEHVDRIIGDFANVLLLGVELEEGDSAASLCTRLSQRMTAILSHSAYSGIDVVRDLSRHHGTPQLSPVVFTAALDLPGGDLLSERVRRVFGDMNWVISQGPQVALDAQVAAADGGLLVNWDIRLDALPEPWVQSLFDDFMATARAVAARPDRFDAPLAIPFRDTVVERPLTSLQKAYLLGRETDLPLGGVAMQEFREYRGRMDPALLRSRLSAMVERHPCLRTHIDVQRLLQVTTGRATLNLKEIDLSGLPRALALARIDALREDYAHALFDLSHAPWNVTLFRLPEQEIIFFARFDALIVDGRSIAALLVELIEGVAPPLTDDDAEEEEDEDGASDARRADATYWSAKLEAIVATPRLPWKQPFDRIATARYERQSIVVSRAAFLALSAAGAKQGLFRNSAITAILLEILSRWSTEEDSDAQGLCVGIPVAPWGGGAFSNRSSFIAVRWLTGKGTLAGRATNLQIDILNGLDHLAFSGVDISRQLYEQIGTAPSLPVVITNGLSWPIARATAPLQFHGGVTQTPQVAMDLRFSASASGELVFDIDYARDAIDPAIVHDMLAAIAKAVEHVAASQTLAIPAEVVVDASHYHLNSPASAGVQAGTFLRKIRARLFDRPDERTAIVSGAKHISYAELGRQTGCIMGALEERQISAGDVVAICLPRSPEHTAVTVACALSGVIWVPIDAASPPKRIDYLLRNCRPSLVVTATGEALGHPTATVGALLARAPSRPPSPNALDALSASDAPAFYLYTSGTTGRPKCVVLSNRGTANVIETTLDEWAVTPEDIFFSATPLHHDMSVFDVLGTLTAGAALVLPGEGEDKDAVRWNELIAEHRVTLWSSVPAMLEMLLACRKGDSLASLRLIAQGGDYIKPAVIAELRTLLPSARLISLGGPTETTIWSIWHDITPDDTDGIPYGRPLPGISYYVLDEQGNHCPIGVAERIHTAGIGVALGYLEDGHLSQTDFVTIRDPAGEEVRAFRTGDRALYRRDGKLIFVGRVNGYVKIRGVRVSLPDVENELIAHPAVRHVLVTDYGEEKQGEAALGALYVPEPGNALSVAAYRDFARQHLPQSHVPSRFLPVEQIPLTRNGKPDRHRARAILAAVAPPVPATARTTPSGSRLFDLYLNIIRPPRPETIAPNADFLRIGLRPQHLKAVAERIREEFAIDLTPGQLVRCRNVGEVEQLILAGAS